MLKDRNIAFFIDVDNVGLNSDNYATVLEQLKGMGTILCGKIYGAGERKHKKIYADAEQHGYRLERPMRVKRRGRKEFDPRIYVDVVDAVNKAPAIDTVCIVARSADMVYLYGYLHSRGVKVVATEDVDDVSYALVDEFVDLGKEPYELELPKTSKAKAERPAAAVQAEPATQSESQELDRTDELLKEIDRLRQDAEQANQPSVQEQVAEQPEQPNQEQPTTNEQSVEPFESQAQTETEQQPTPEEETASIVDEAKSLLERIAEMRDEQEAAEQPAETPQTQTDLEQPTEQPQEEVPAQPEEPAQTPTEQPVSQSDEPVAQQPNEEQPAEEQPAEEQPAEEQPVSTQRPTVLSGNDADLIKRIEAIRKNSQGSDDDYLDEIRKLLDGLE